MILNQLAQNIMISVPEALRWNTYFLKRRFTMDYLKLITLIALYAYQVCCWTLKFGYASERLLKFQPTYKMRRTNCMVTNLSNNQSTHQKGFVRDNAGFFASVKNDNSKIIRIYCMNEQGEQGKIYISIKLRSLSYRAQSNMSYRLTSGIFWQPFVSLR